jgi:hypothetical protein
MIDLSRVCDTATSLICYALIMFVIYSWIKIKLKVLIYLSIQKPYCRHFSFMAGFVFYWCELQKMADESHIVANCHERVLCV